MEEMLVFTKISGRDAFAQHTSWANVRECSISQPVLVSCPSSGWSLKAYFTKGSCCFICLQVLDLLHSRYYYYPRWQTAQFFNMSHHSLFRRYHTKHLYFSFGSLLEWKLNPYHSSGL